MFLYLSQALKTYLQSKNLHTFIYISWSNGILKRLSSLPVMRWIKLKNN